MSCCGGCQSGGGCETVLDGLYGLSGLNGLMGQLLSAGSIARVGFAYNYDMSQAGVDAERQGASWLRSAILTQLQALGVFSSINVSIQPPAYQGFQDGYITVQVTLNDDQSSPANIGDMAQFAIQNYAPGIVIKRRDQVVIDYAAPGSVAQVTPQPTPQPLPPGQQSRCVWETMSFGDYVACQLGITSPIGGVGVGAFGALIAVGVGALVLVTVLKR